MADLDVTTGERVQNALVSADAGAGAGTLAKVLADIEAAIAAKQDAEATLAALALLNDTPVGTGSDQLCAGNDSRLSNARTPTAHATSHQSGGSDPISLDAGDISFTSGSGLSSTDAAAALDELKDLLDAVPGSAGENLATATSSGGTDVPVDFDSKGRLLLTITGNITNFAAPTNLIGGTSVYREHWLFVQASGATRTIAKDAFGATEYNHAGTLDPAADWSLDAGEILPVKITYYHNGTSATVYAELFPPATAVRIDASAFSGNLDNTVTDVQALADAVDGLTVGGSATWGSITGTLSSQTDLQSAIDAATFDPASAINWWIREEFFGGASSSQNIGQLQWRLQGSPTLATLGGTQDHPGVAKLQGTTATSGWEGIILPNVPGNVFQPLHLDDVDWYRAIFRIETRDGDFAVGLIQAQNDVINNDGVYLEGLSTDTNWFVVCRQSGAAVTRVDTGVAINTSWVNFYLYRGATGWIAKINGGSPTTEITTNLPVASNGYYPAFLNQKATAAQTLWHCDAMFVGGSVTR